jgi:hypothetical protein
LCSPVALLFAIPDFLLLPPEHKLSVLVSICCRGPRHPIPLPLCIQLSARWTWWWLVGRPGSRTHRFWAPFSTKEASVCLQIDTKSWSVLLSAVWSKLDVWPNAMLLFLCSIAGPLGQPKLQLSDRPFPFQPISAAKSPWIASDPKSAMQPLRPLNKKTPATASPARAEFSSQQCACSAPNSEGNTCPVLLYPATYRPISGQSVFSAPVVCGCGTTDTPIRPQFVLRSRGFRLSKQGHSSLKKSAVFYSRRKQGIEGI